MKVTKLTIHNIGMIADTSIDLNQPLILFYGEIRQGKTTILNAVRWCFGGAFPSDIIRHGEKEAHVQLDFDGGCIRREWYASKDGSTKAREVQFVRNGKPVPSPVGEIKRFLNPFLLDQDFFRNKTELERKQYFTELFAVDTTALDTEQFNKDREAVQLRAKIKGYGEIDLVKVDSVDVTELEGKLRRMKMGYATEKQELENQLAALASDHEAACAKIDSQNDEIREHNSAVETAKTNKATREKRIAELKRQLAEEEAELAKVVIPQVKQLLVRPAAPDRAPIQKKILELTPDTSALDKQIQDAGATNVRAEQYQANKKRADEKAADEKKLTALDARLREIKKEKTAKLKGVSESCGIEGLAFDDAGNFIYESTQAGMLSTSQIMKLSSALSDLYPEGFGLDLLDRGESLGKSIFGFIERAQAEEKTILATIVGEKPAEVPEHVGVFVVENGKVKA